MNNKIFVEVEGETIEHDLENTSHILSSLSIGDEVQVVEYNLRFPFKPDYKLNVIATELLYLNGNTPSTEQES